MAITTVHKFNTRMFSVTEYGCLVLVPVPIIFGVTPAMIDKQYSMHVV